MTIVYDVIHAMYLCKVKVSMPNMITCHYYILIFEWCVLSRCGFNSMNEQDICAQNLLTIVFQLLVTNTPMETLTEDLKGDFCII
jgi:hypothetical protein